MKKITWSEFDKMNIDEIWNHIEKLQEETGKTKNTLLGPGKWHGLDHFCMFSNEPKNNARLIVAAPDLLDALNALEVWWRKPNHMRTIESIVPVLIIALDAFAKATREKKMNHDQ
jgi:hypothetical protein